MSNIDEKIKKQREIQEKKREVQQIRQQMEQKMEEKIQEQTQQIREQMKQIMEEKIQEQTQKIRRQIKKIDEIKEATLLRYKKIRLQLTFLQIKALQPHVDNYRYTQNKTVCLLNELSSENSYEKEEIWKKIDNEDTPWLLATPNSLRRHASNAICENRHFVLTKLKEENIKHFTQKFISKKKKEWSLGGIEPTSVTILGKRTIQIYPRLNVGAFTSLEDLPETVNHKCMLHFDGLDYYFIIPEDKKVCINFAV